MKKIIAERETALLEYLYEIFADKSKTTVKSYLSHRQISVNGCATTQFDFPVKKGDTIEFSSERTKESFRHPQLRIVYEDDYLIVINKREGLLSIATDKQPLRTAFSILSDYLKRDNPAARIFVLHRLDRETSGLMMFAKDQNIKQQMQRDWSEVVVERKYYAVVEGVVEKEQERISTYLTESKALIVYATTRENGKIANTDYRVLKRSATNTLLELKLETGRKNQIRCHLNYINHPIIGDKKYGAKTNPIGRVALHAGSLSFIHPVTGSQLDFSTPIPREFTEMF